MAAFAPTPRRPDRRRLEVPHTHLHVIPIDTEGDLDFANADPAPDPEALDDAAERLRDALRAAGHGTRSPTA